MTAAVVTRELTVVRDGRTALHGVSLRAEAGERVFLLGPNGAGKTTLLLALVGALPFEGTVEVGGVTLGPRTVDRIRQDVGFVFADPADQLFTDEVRREVAFGPESRRLDGGEVRERVDVALRAVCAEHLSGRSPAALSLGEQRRVALAAALAVRPSLLLLDEPTAALDPRARRTLLGVMETLDATLVVATHDLDAALALGGRVVLLRDGKVTSDGPAAAVLRDAALLDAAGL